MLVLRILKLGKYFLKGALYVVQVVQMGVDKERNVEEAYSDKLQCPYCDHRFLRQNCMGISSQQDPCSHLVIFDPVFSTRVRVSETEFEAFERIEFEQILDELSGELTLVRDSDPEEGLDDDCWTAVYHRYPDDVVPFFQSS